jgi:hypothetical protein
VLETNRDHSIHIEKSFCRIKCTHYFVIGYKTFIVHAKILFHFLLKHSSLWPLADGKPMSNDLVHGSACLLSLFVNYNLNVET